MQSFDEQLDAIGTDLRAARESLGWTLSDVAKKLRIRLSFLEALEAGQLTRIPGNVYARGFLRNYATALGLDAEETARRYWAKAGGMATHPELVFLVPEPERGMRASALISLGVILIGGVYASWYRMSGEGGGPARTVAANPPRLASIAEPALSGPPGERVAALEPSLANPPRINAPRISADPGAAMATMIAMPVTVPAQRPDPSLQSAPVAPQKVDAANPDGVRIVLRFTADTWIQVKEPGARPLLSKVMKTGETFAVPDMPDVILTTGNAAGVEVVVDGTVAPPLGGAGVVRRDVPLDPDRLKAGVIPVSTRP
ncbi:MAG: RodZ domain-containing protein [Acetobacteraceae bacterium]|jgi:cytoskeleton protein RodZ